MILKGKSQTMICHIPICACVYCKRLDKGYDPIYYNWVMLFTLQGNFFHMCLMIITLWNIWKNQSIYFNVVRLLGCKNVKEVYWIASAIQEYFGINEFW